MRGDANNSPSLTRGYGDIGIAETVANHQQPPTASAGIEAAVVPPVPSPSVGGMPGRSHALGWSTGLRFARHLHARFTGRTLVVPNMGAHPAEGPVGFSTRLDRLSAGTQALYTDYVPDPKEVAAMFTSPNPILAEMRYQDE